MSKMVSRYVFNNRLVLRRCQFPRVMSLLVADSTLRLVDWKHPFIIISPTDVIRPVPESFTSFLWVYGFNKSLKA